MCRSEPHTPARVSLIRIAPGSGSGTGYSRSSNSPPYALSSATRPFIEAPPWNGFSERVAARGPRCQHPGPRVGWGGFRDLKEETVKLLLFDDYRLGVLRGDAVVDVSDTVKDIPHTGAGGLVSGLIARFADYRKKIDDAAAPGQPVPLAQGKNPPPPPKPPNTACRAGTHM